MQQQGYDLPGPDAVGSTGQWTLPSPDSSGRSVVTGRFLGMASSQRTDHNKRARHVDGFAPVHVHCSTCRWTEIRVFREESGYVILRAGRTIVPGEVDRFPLSRVRTAYEVVELLTTRVDGVASLTRQPAMALAQCAAHDVPVRDAYENRAVG